MWNIRLITNRVEKKGHVYRVIGVLNPAKSSLGTPELWTNVPEIELRFLQLRH